MNDCYTIYAIRCKATKRMYIGRTKQSTEERIKSHLTLLRSNKHTSKLMQEDYNKYGEDNFEYYELETGLKFEDRNKECFYMDRYKTCNPKYGYNRQDNHNRAKGCIPKAKGLPDIPK
jgi:hypothetical protein